MSFCFLYNVVSENYSVQNSPWGGGEGGLLSAQGLVVYFTVRRTENFDVPNAKFDVKSGLRMT